MGKTCCRLGFTMETRINSSSLAKSRRKTLTATSRSKSYHVPNRHWPFRRRQPSLIFYNDHLFFFQSSLFITLLFHQLNSTIISVILSSPPWSFARLINDEAFSSIDFSFCKIFDYFSFMTLFDNPSEQRRRISPSSNNNRFNIHFNIRFGSQSP